MLNAGGWTDGFEKVELGEKNEFIGIPLFWNPPLPLLFCWVDFFSEPNCIFDDGAWILKFDGDGSYFWVGVDNSIENVPLNFVGSSTSKFIDGLKNCELLPPPPIPLNCLLFSVLRFL